MFGTTFPSPCLKLSAFFRNVYDSRAEILDPNYRGIEPASLAKNTSGDRARMLGVAFRYTLG